MRDHQTRQIINYDAGIVLIDLHLYALKQLQTIQISDTEYRATSCQRRTEPAEQQPATSAFPNQMIEQVACSLGKRGPGISPAWVIEIPSETNVRKEGIYIN